MALALAQKVILRMIDPAGKSGTTAVWVPMDGTANPADAVADYIPLVEACSAAVVTGVVGRTGANTAIGIAATNSYDIRDKAVFELLSSQNTIQRIAVGDLATAVVASDGETIITSTGVGAALVTALVGNVVDKAGNAVTFLRAYRQRSRNLKSSMRYQG
jgi:hypothetical protein